MASPLMPLAAISNAEADKGPVDKGEKDDAPPAPAAELSGMNKLAVGRFPFPSAIIAPPLPPVISIVVVPFGVP